MANRHTRVTEFERDVRAAVYHGFREKGWSPSVAELAAMLGASDAEVGAALRRLGEEHALVLQPDGESVRMAHPFSAVPTDTLVTIGGRQWFGNCVGWPGDRELVRRHGAARHALTGDGRVHRLRRDQRGGERRWRGAFPRASRALLG